MPKVIAGAVFCAALVGTSVALDSARQAGTASASRLTGSWRAEFVGPMGPRPQMVDDIIFTISDGPTGLTGTAKTEPEWPGELDVSAIRVDGDKFSSSARAGLVGRSTACLTAVHA